MKDVPKLSFESFPICHGLHAPLCRINNFFDFLEVGRNLK